MLILRDKKKIGGYESKRYVSLTTDGEDKVRLSLN
jgi:hypothetical protein